MLPIWAIMAIAGAAKGTMDKKQEARDRHAAAITKLYQPWTGDRKSTRLNSSH